MRRARLHELIDHIPEHELLAAELFLELLAEPAPAMTVEDMAIVERLLTELRARRTQ
jgi:hypothetical protein